MDEWKQLLVELKRFQQDGTLQHPEAGVLLTKVLIKARNFIEKIGEREDIRVLIMDSLDIFFVSFFFLSFTMIMFDVL